MRLIVDANIVFAALITPGPTIRLLLHGGHDLYAPETLREELERHADTLHRRSSLPSEDVARFLSILLGRITLIPNQEFRKHVSRAQVNCPDPDDVAYFALALHLDAALWSNDAALRAQTVVRVVTTAELLRATEDS